MTDINKVLSIGAIFTLWILIYLIGGESLGLWAIYGSCTGLLIGWLSTMDWELFHHTRKICKGLRHIHSLAIRLMSEAEENFSYSPYGKDRIFELETLGISMYVEYPESFNNDAEALAYLESYIHKYESIKFDTGGILALIC